MAKRLLSAKRIKEEINRRMETNEALPEFYRRLRFSTPRQADPAERGANWHVDNLQASIATESPIPQSVLNEISRIVGEVQRDFDCSDW